MANNPGRILGPSASRRGLLARIPFLAQAPPELQAEFERASEVVRLEAGEYLIHEGDSCGHFTLLVSGTMRVFKISRESGHEITVCSVGPGEACPLHVACVLSSRPVTATAMAEEPIEAVVIPAATFRAMIARHEALRSFVFEMLSTRLSEAMALVEEVAFGTVAERLADRLVSLLLRAGGPLPSVEITHAELAADLGTAREVVSRLLKEFERLGAIALLRGRIELRNATPLQARVQCAAPRRGVTASKVQEIRITSRGRRASRLAGRSAREIIEAAWKSAMMKWQATGDGAAQVSPGSAPACMA